MKTEILRVQFDALTMPEAVSAAEALLRGKQGGTVVTANPELLLTVQRDEACLAAVNKADLVLADGIGDLYAARILGKGLPERVAGADLVPELLRGMAERGESVFLYGARPGVAEKAGQRLKRDYPGLSVAGCENGYLSDETALWDALDGTRPTLLLVALGAPRQELWMAKNRGRTQAVMIGVGGLLDVFAGEIKRAPESWRRAKLEWLYRLLRQPRRFARMAKLPLVLALAAKERLWKR